MERRLSRKGRGGKREKGRRGGSRVDSSARNGEMGWDRLGTNVEERRELEDG